jgi:hypothetical protein
LLHLFFLQIRTGLTTRDLVNNGPTSSFPV